MSHGARMSWTTKAAGKSLQKVHVDRLHHHPGYADLNLVCCIYHKPRRFDESSGSESDDGSSSSSSSSEDEEGDDKSGHPHAHHAHRQEKNAYERIPRARGKAKPNGEHLYHSSGMARLMPFF